MAGQPDTFTSPIGRLVQGDAWEMQTKDQQGNARVVKTGPNAGQPAPVIFMGVAFPKLTPDGRENQDWAGFWAQMNRIARRDFAHLFDANGVCLARQFAWKVVDGDGVDDKGKPYGDREGFRGHWIVRFSSSFVPKVFHANRYGAADQVQDKNALRRGFYVRIAGTMVGNDNVQNPGLYLNASLVEIAGYGPEIMGGADPNAAFATPSAAAPAGMSATPMGSNVPPAPGAPPAPSAPPPAPSAPPPAPVGPTLTAKAAGQTYEGMKAAGWTDATLVEHGYMIASVPAPSAPPPAPSAPPPAPSAPPPAPSAPPPPAPPPSAPPPAPPPSAPPPAPVGRTMLPPANGASYESLIAAGWTDALLIQHGYMAA